MLNTSLIEAGAPTVFIVAVEPDRDVAHRLGEALRRLGWTAGTARDLPLGRPRDVELPRSLRRVVGVAVVISDRWCGDKHDWFQREQVKLAIDLARVHGSPIVFPIILDGAIDRVPYGLGRVTGAHVSREAVHEAAPAIGHQLALLAPARLPPTTDHAHTFEAPIGQGPIATRSRAIRVPHSADYRVVPQPGEIFADRWRLEEHIGHGGFASVWSARDLEYDRWVALKILHPRWTHDPAQLDRFRRGAVLMAGIHHPSVVRVLEAPHSSGPWHYYVMELLTGGNLEQARTAPARSVSVTAGVANLLEIAEALGAVHAQGIVHGDVKPANIVLTDAGRACLTDFDLVWSEDFGRSSRTGPVGTFLYSAPEILRPGTSVSTAADIYGLAATAVFVLTGARLDQNLLRDTEGYLSEHGIHPAVRRILLRGLAEAAADRPPTAVAFARALNNTISERGAFVSRRADLPRRGTLAIGACIGGALAGLGLWFASGEATSDPATPPDMIRVEPGRQQVVSERPGDSPREVSFDHPLLVQRHEVTHREWRAHTPDHAPGEVVCPDCPVTEVDWYDAIRYANRRSRAEGLVPCYRISECPPGAADRRCPTVESTADICFGYRLPTEVEWLRAAALADREAEPARAPQPVIGDRLAGFDGGASEWCQSLGLADGSAPGSGRPILGANHSDPPDARRPTVRRVADPETRDPRVGFRLVRSTGSR